MKRIKPKLFNIFHSEAFTKSKVKNVNIIPGFSYHTLNSKPNNLTNSPLNTTHNLGKSSKIKYIFSNCLFDPSLCLLSSLLTLSARRDPLHTYLKLRTDEYLSLENKLSAGILNKKENIKDTKLKYLVLSKYIPLVVKLEKIESDISELKTFIESSEDQSLVEIAKQDYDNLLIEAESLDKQILELVIPSEPIDDSGLLLEIGAGIGGTEAMLFANELFSMYMSYVNWNNWGSDILNAEYQESGGLRKASVLINGQGAFRYLRQEGGVHRVQRNPLTEKSGRLHTSTVVVAILPTPQAIDINLDPSDVRVDVFRAKGAGGQHVNTTESAVRVVHLPTSLTVECQTSRSQMKNKETAMQVLKSKLYDKQLETQANQERSQRKVQYGSRARSEKIRTYNFPNERLTDARLSSTKYHVSNVLEGGPALHELLCDLDHSYGLNRLKQEIEKSLQSQLS